MPRADVKRAFLAVWIILTVVAVSAVAAPLLLAPDTVHALAPQCERQVRFRQPCSLCGMTTAFVHISHGRVEQAQAANTFSLALYALFCGNALAMVGFLTWRRLCKH